MLILISPAKSVDFETKSITKKFTMPDFLDKSEILIQELRKYSANDISKLMNVSSEIGELNFHRNLVWQKEFTPKNAKQALLAFTGEVYRGINALSLTTKELNESQNYLRILSGLYGLLRPLDLIQAYRLEMGTKLPNVIGSDLYQFWGLSITEKINETLDELNKKTVVNLASNEYFKAVKPKLIKARIVTPIFKEEKDGQYKTIAIFAKKARGLMTRFIIQNKLKNPNDLKAFDLAGYRFSHEMSNDKEFVFVR